MLIDIMTLLIKYLVSIWLRDVRIGRILIISSSFLFFSGVLVALTSELFLINAEPFNYIGYSLLAVSFFLLLGVAVFGASLESTDRERRIEEVKKRVDDHPEETKAAWELARSNLEAYLQQNLTQIRAIFWLSVLVMIVGFALIGIGVFRIYASPDNIQPSLVAAISGIVVNFIGATFLVIYRSTMNQATSYVTMLERINAVGMAVQILEAIDASEHKLKQETKADIAKTLLSMYVKQF